MFVFPAGESVYCPRAGRQFVGISAELSMILCFPLYILVFLDIIPSERKLTATEYVLLWIVANAAIPSPVMPYKSDGDMRSDLLYTSNSLQLLFGLPYFY